MPILLDYQNREVRLTEERMAHILVHPEMVGMEAQKKEKTYGRASKDLV